MHSKPGSRASNCIAAQSALGPAAVLLVCCAFFPGCATPEKKPTRIHIKGSDTMLVLTRLWAEEFMIDHEGIAVYAEGGGTALGARALADGEADICAASRPLLPQEVQRLADRFGVIGLSTRVAKDALTVFVHPKNPIQDLSMAQLQTVFSGEVSNWKELGGADRPVLLVARSPASGTFAYFQQHALNGLAYGPPAFVATTTEQVVGFVAQNEGAIGYGGMAYGPQVNHCAIDGITPTIENIGNDTYPLIRYLFLCTANLPRGHVKAFIDWVLLEENQDLVQRVGYFPIWSRIN